MATSLVGSCSNTTGGTSTANPTVVLPTGISTGDIAILCLCTASTTITPILAGWTVSTPLDNGANERTTLLTKTLASTDSGTTVTITAGTSRWAIAGVVVTGNTSALDVNVTAQDTSLQTSYTVPGFTPASGSELVVLLSGNQRAFGTTDGAASVPAGYTSQRDVATTFTGASDVGVLVATKQLTATTLAQAATSGTWNGASRSNAYIVTVAPAAAVGVATFVASNATMTLSVSAKPAVSATAALSGAGTLSAPSLTPAVSTAAAFSGVGTLTAEARLAATTTVALDGAGTLAASGYISYFAAAALSGSGSLSSLGYSVHATTQTIQFRRNTVAAAYASNPVLRFGEPGWDGQGIRVGDIAGTPWRGLPHHVLSGELILNARDYGALGNGVTDDTAALAAAGAAAAAFGATLYYPPGIYAVSTLTVTGGVHDGRGVATIKQTTAAANTVNITGAATLRGLTVDGNALPTATIVNIPVGVPDVLIDACIIRNSPVNATVGVRVHDGCHRTTIRRSTLDTVGHGVYVDGTVSDLLIADNTITNWMQRGVYIVGTASTGVDRFTITRNRITDLAAGGTVRQPIAIAGNDARPHTSMTLDDNIVIGNNRSWTAATNPGTADQISFQHVTGFKCRGNISLYGGDNGFSVAVHSTSGVVSGNVARFNDTGGISVGSSSAGASNITVTSNVCVSNGQNRESDRTLARSGIRCYTASGLIIAGNTLGDDQATKTQLYGVSFTNCTNIVYGPDVDVGNIAAMYFLDSGNSAVATAVGGASAQPTAGAVLRLPGVATDAMSCPAPTWTPGNLDVRALVAPNLWASGTTQVFLGQTDVGTTDKCFYFAVNGTGKLILGYSTSGTTTTLVTSTVAIPGAVDGSPLGVRVTYDVTGTTVTFWASPDGVTWTSFDTKTTAGTTALHVSAHPVYVGVRDGADFPFAGLVSFAEVRNGIGGAVVAGVDFRGKWTGVGAAGNVWTITGAAWSWQIVEAGVDKLVSDLTAIRASIAVIPTAHTPQELTTTASITNTASETILWAPTLLAAGSLVAGVTKFTLKLGGKIDAQAASGVFTIRVKVNGTTIASFNVAASQTNAATGLAWYEAADLYLDTIGSGGAVSAVLRADCLAVGGTTWTPQVKTIEAVAVDLSTGCAVTVTGLMATASASNTLYVTRAALQQDA